jgi:hypothetical protein
MDAVKEQLIILKKSLPIPVHGLIKLWELHQQD